MPGSGGLKMFCSKRALKVLWSSSVKPYSWAIFRKGLYCFGVVSAGCVYDWESRFIFKLN